MNTISKKTLKNIKTRITEITKPKKIILFGSYADNRYSNDSDIDICIITDMQNKRLIDLTREVRKSLLEIIDLPLDILIYKNKDFMERLKNSKSFEHTISQKGIVLYEQ